MIWGSIAWIPHSYRAVLYVRYNDIKKWKEINLMSSKRYIQGNNELHTCCLIHGNKWIISFFIFDTDCCYFLWLLMILMAFVAFWLWYVCMACGEMIVRLEESGSDFRLTLIWIMEFLIFYRKYKENVLKSRIFSDIFAEIWDLFEKSF